MAALAKQAETNLALDQAWGHNMPANDEPREGAGMVGGHALACRQYRDGWRVTLDGVDIYVGCGEETRRIYDQLCLALSQG